MYLFCYNKGNKINYKFISDPYFPWYIIKIRDITLHLLSTYFLINEFFLFYRISYNLPKSSFVDSPIVYNTSKFEMGL